MIKHHRNIIKQGLLVTIFLLLGFVVLLTDVRKRKRMKRDT
jgi:hypothetical protein